MALGSAGNTLRVASMNRVVSLLQKAATLKSGSGTFPTRSGKMGEVFEQPRDVVTRRVMFFIPDMEKRFCGFRTLLTSAGSPNVQSQLVMVDANGEGLIEDVSVNSTSLAIQLFSEVNDATGLAKMITSRILNVIAPNAFL